MPDVKAAPCDHSAAGPPASCSIERCLSDRPAPLSAIGPPLPVFSTCTSMTCASLGDGLEAGSGEPSCHHGSLLTSFGLRYCSTSSMYPVNYVAPPAQNEGGSSMPTPDVCGSSRMYRSMENLHWPPLHDSRLYSFSPPYKSMESEFIFHCTATSHWYNPPTEASPMEGLMSPSEGMPFYPWRLPVKRELPVFARVPQWLFPSVNEKFMNGNAKKELKEKLKLQSSRVAEPNKPLRPQALASGPASSKDRSEHGPTESGCSLHYSDAHQAPHGSEQSMAPFSRMRASIMHRMTSPEEIKQEVMRRLQLRRQSSTPNLHQPSMEDLKQVSKSQTSESFVRERNKFESKASEGTTDRKRQPKGKLHIPSFEEFKRMRKRESWPVAPAVDETPPRGSTAKDSDLLKEDRGATTKDTPSMECEHRGSETPPSPKAVSVVAPDSSNSNLGHCFVDNSSLAPHLCTPICTSPVPRSPLQTLVTPQAGDTAQSLNTTPKKCGASLAVPDQPHLTEAQLSCCSSLLMEATDLSSYGAKISRMKDGFIDSALDLIKKSCSAEIAAVSPVTVSRDIDKADITAQEESNQSTAVSMTMPACSTATETKSPGAQPAVYPHSGCRRSSSDAAYDTSESMKAQRECRLRPHFSDPMPADASKRKQLEMKIAAAARLHSQRQHHDKEAGPTIAKSKSLQRGGSEPKPGKSTGSSGCPQKAKQRWSNLSCLSTDSGVVGMTNEKDDDEESQIFQEGKSADVDRVDSGIGPAIARNWRNKAVDAVASIKDWDSRRPCSDCGAQDMQCEPRLGRRDHLCEKCAKLRTERKEAILEFINTESSYGEDLRIIREEFYVPMQTAGLLTCDQLSVVFSNVQELIEVNENFTEVLQDAIDQAFDQGDEDLLTVCIGEIFLEFVNMLPAFQTYCLQQSASINMLNTLEKEKELLRIFLDVSQNDNTALRRMNLRSFLMAPLQRVTKYPLLLSRISNATSEYHPEHSSLREAKSRVESHLEHINMKTKQEGNSWSLRSFRRDSRKNREVINIEMREISMKTVGWPRENTRFVMEGLLQLSQPADGQWVKKGSKALKFQNMHVLLMVNMKRTFEVSLDGAALENLVQQELVRDAVLVLFKDKSNGKFAVLREPIHLSNCVVSADPDCDDTFELLDIRREAFVFRAAEKSRTNQWFRQVKRYSRELGSWKKRRNALPNIMISTTQSRS
ncbi:LOW QUALITY PROTEIN: uncharacterized protein si:dkey-91i10.2 [Erpetoichthys calabaricus]|uniref:LOW QUALITY PROTEIN: uncharacterized protein si:dkey-91i10.2 n=1 Tax=Erpetoichthys calabaricus TaxID=27687 RepID=UPI00223453E8|nr:LOW QUALITY PROTEIN: uncharacterized protein si:dkey-91i10.2 [Erpetoichthys calabaricus]